jgi:hypothetical protein
MGLGRPKHESYTQNAEARHVWSVSSWSFTSKDSTAHNLLMVCIKSPREPYLTSLPTPTRPRHAAPALLLRHSVAAAVRSIWFAAPYWPPHSARQTAQLLHAQPHRPPRLLCTASDNMMNYLVFLTSGKIIKKLTMFLLFWLRISWLCLFLLFLPSLLLAWMAGCLMIDVEVLFLLTSRGCLWSRT